MVRSVMTVLVLAIFPGLIAGQEPVLQVSERATLEMMVRFDFDQSTITAESDQLLREKLPILRSTPTFTLRLEGHADERGSVEYNLALGSRRAESVRDFLTSQGISADRLTTTSFGEDRPLVNQSDQAAWAQNRRVEFVITGAPIVAAADDAAADSAAAAAAADALANQDGRAVDCDAATTHRVFHEVSGTVAVPGNIRRYGITTGDVSSVFAGPVSNR